MLSLQKLLWLNVGLLGGVVAIGFNAYLPVLDEIISQNRQMAQYERQFKAIQPMASQTQPLLKQTRHTAIYALPAKAREYLSQELEAVAQKYQAKLIQVEDRPEQAETFPKWKLQSTPYVIGFQVKEPAQLAQILVDLEKQFPEIALQKITYHKEVAILDALLLTSPQGARLFSAGD